MQNPILQFRKSSIISEKPGYLSENLKLRRASTTIKLFAENFVLNNVYKKGIQDTMV